MKRLNAIVLAAWCVTSAAMSPATAGGFNRGVANLDGLYLRFDDPAKLGLGLYAGVTYVSPQRSYDKITMTLPTGGNPPLTIVNEYDVEFTNDYAIPYFSVGGRVFGDVNCVGSYSQPFGADSEYSGLITFHTASQKLETHEYGLTCGYGFDFPSGTIPESRLSLIGGAFYETVEYTQARNFTGYPFGVSGDSTVSLDSNAWGYRIGIAYEIPDYGLKAQLIYRSQTNHDASGEYANTPFAALAIASGALLPQEAAAIYGPALSAAATASASLPATVEFTWQTGLPTAGKDWGAFGSIKWTDWSVLRDIQVVEGIAGQTFSTTRFFFKDGWTINGGIGHIFNEKLSGSLGVTWDKGVSTGWDTLTDTWTFGGGFSYNMTEQFQLRAGGAAIYFTEGTKSQAASPLDYVATSPAQGG